MFSEYCRKCLKVQIIIFRHWFKEDIFKSSSCPLLNGTLNLHWWLASKVYCSALDSLSRGNVYYPSGQNPSLSSCTLHSTTEGTPEAQWAACCASLHAPDGFQELPSPGTNASDSSTVNSSGHLFCAPYT